MMWRKAGILLIGLSAGLVGCGMNDAASGSKSWTSPAETPTTMPSPMQADADYKKAIEQLTLLKYTEAEPEFFRLGQAYESFGQYAKAAECLFWRSYCQEKLGRGDQAALGYEQIKRFYPQTAAARQARARLEEMGR